MNSRSAGLFVGAFSHMYTVDRDRWTPLHLACYCGHLEVAEYLLDHNADPSIRNYFGETALQVAKESDQPGTGEVVKMLRRRSIAK
ncbi:ankyrin [Coprinellus micaceus]|uniref:Ankyrin n=1 Tax=Coprinellus micaceus TaxID=71717 RepID=A0A4Y7R8P3_COPMI|nr:ankyrin [Coprinellus micaceus]